MHCRYRKYFIIHRQQSISCYAIKHIQRILVFTLRCIQAFFNFRLRALIRSKCPQPGTGTHSHIRHTCEGRYPLPRRDLFPHAHFHFVIPASRPTLPHSSYPRRRVSIAPQGLIKHPIRTHSSSPLRVSSPVLVRRHTRAGGYPLPRRDLLL